MFVEVFAGLNYKSQLQFSHCLVVGVVVPFRGPRNKLGEINLEDDVLWGEAGI